MTKKRHLTQSHKDKISASVRRQKILNPLSSEARRRLSIMKTGKVFSDDHREKIARGQRNHKLQKKVFNTMHNQRLRASSKQCSACSVVSRWIYNVRMPFTEYVIQLCDTDLVSQFYALSLEDKRKVEIIS